MKIATLLAIDLDPYWFPCDGPVLGIPHGLNVLTNLPFLFIGAIGLARVLRGGGLVAANGNRIGLWLSVFLLAFGSGAYHWAPSPATLTADRVAIAGILAFTVADVWGAVVPRARRAGVTLGLLAVTQGSILLWLLGGTSWTYGVLQAVGAAAVLVLAVRGVRAGSLPKIALRSTLAFVALYAGAKLFELFDGPICDLTGSIGGHPIKHLFSAAGLAVLLPWLGRSAAAVGAGGPPEM